MIPSAGKGIIDSGACAARILFTVNANHRPATSTSEPPWPACR
jgi:hypothetical protein